MVSTKETKERDRGTMKASEVYHGHAICLQKTDLVKWQIIYHGNRT